jgi:hypothetical protein
MTILDIIHCPVSYLKYDVSETIFFLRFLLVPTQLAHSAELVHVSYQQQLKMETQSSLRNAVI